MKKFNFTIYRFTDKDDYPKSDAVAHFQMEVVDAGVASDLAHAMQLLLPFEGFLTSDEAPYVLDMSDPSGNAAVQP